VYVTDMGHYLHEGRLPLDIPAPAWRFAAYLGALVQAASLQPAGQLLATPLPCRRRPGRRHCPGRLQVRRLDVPPEIVWGCPACGEEGVISGWKGTPWDFSPPRTPGPEDVEVVLAEPEYRMLRDIEVLDRDAYRVIAGARLTGDGVLLTADPDELEHLAGFVAAETNHAADRRRLRQLEELFGLLETHLPG
jgi:hypothetical protein